MQITTLTSQKFKFYSFISMFLLVFVHGYNLNETYLQPFSTVREPLNFTTFTEYFLSNGIFRFRIPMLFMISGYLYALNDIHPTLQRMKKRFRTLLIPYLIWSAVGLGITLLWQQFPITAQAVHDAQLDQMGDNRLYVEIGWGGMLTRWLFSPISFQLWFIRVLLIYNILYPILRWMVTRIPIPWFIITGLLWFGTAGFYFAEGEGLFFFSFGIWVCKQNKFLITPPKWMNVAWMWVIFIGLSLLKTGLAFYLQPSGITFLLLSFLHKAVVFSGLISMWYGADGLVRFCMEKKWFLWLSSFSFIIYALHVPLVNYCTRLLFRYLNYIPEHRLLTYFLLPMIIITACILIGWLMRTFMPRVYSITTGGRGLNQHNLKLTGQQEND